MEDPGKGYCACGCGEVTTLDRRGLPRRFIKGHQARGANNSRFGCRLSEKTKERISLARKAQGSPWWIGRPHSATAKRKMAAAHESKGYAPRTPRRGITYKCKVCGRPYYRPKCVTQTNFCSLRCSGIGNCTGAGNPFFGRTHSAETKERLRIAAAEQRSRAVVLPTQPERRVHKTLQELKVVFETEKVVGRFCVDVFVPDLKVVIFVDGCYWHACPAHFPKAKRPKNDAARVPYLTKCGYKVIILWEHETRNWTHLQKLLSEAVLATG